MNTFSSDIPYHPDEYEAEKASNSYLMSLIALMVGLPMPVINLIATAIFYLGNRKSSDYVRWHCTQALLSQGLFLCINAAGIYWTVSILFSSHHLNNYYIAYMLTAILFNLFGFIATMRAAIRTRKGIHVTWWLIGPLTDILMKRA
jgi:hypothetical protein